MEDSTQPLSLYPASGPAPLMAPASGVEGAASWLGYVAAFCFPVLLLVGVNRSPEWTWLALLLLMALMAIADARWPTWEARRQQHVPNGYSAPFSALVRLLAITLLACAAWLGWLAHAAAWPTAMALGAALGVVWGTLGGGVAHELSHSPRVLDRSLAWAMFTAINLPGFMIEHHRGHHPKLGTRSDPGTPHQHETLWRFLWHFLGWTTVNSWRREIIRQRQMKHTLFHSPLMWLTLILAFIVLVLFAAMQFAVLIAWATFAGVALLLFSAQQYVGHYGLGRQRVGFRLEPIGPHHMWSARPGMSRWLLLMPDHNADHHMRPWVCHARLQYAPQGLLLPSSYLACVFAAMVPGMWFELIHPALEDARRCMHVADVSSAFSQLDIPL